MNKSTGILIFHLLLSSFIFGQTTDSVSIKLTGKWLLVKHTLLENGKLINKITPNQIYTYEFNADGTYQVSYFDKQLGTTLNAGKWKIIDNENKIHFYDNTDVPDDPMISIGDHDLTIIKLTSTEFITEEYLFSEDPIGKSYYIHQ